MGKVLWSLYTKNHSGWVGWSICVPNLRKMIKQRLEAEDYDNLYFTFQYTEQFRRNMFDHVWGLWTSLNPAIPAGRLGQVLKALGLVFVAIPFFLFSASHSLILFLRSLSVCFSFEFMLRWLGLCDFLLPWVCHHLALVLFTCRLTLLSLLLTLTLA